MNKYDKLIGKEIIIIGYKRMKTKIIIAKIDPLKGITTILSDSGDDAWCLNYKDWSIKDFKACFKWAIKQIKAGKLKIKDDPTYIPSSDDTIIATCAFK